tara:strand:+ start:1826 stop:2197 length:372 start_codon:yes stop_codon:yes gene_type:complete
VIRFQAFCQKFEYLLDNFFFKELNKNTLCYYFFSISVTSPCPAINVNALGITNWSIWTCARSSFDCKYDDKETCLLLEGEVTVTSEGEEPVKFGAGDLVVFPTGFHSRWDIHKAVRKHYQFCD